MNRACRIGVESVYGTAVTPDKYFTLAGESMKRKPTLRTIRPERRHAPMRQVETRRSTAGTLDLYADYTNVGYLLRWLVGVPDTTVFIDRKIHVFTPLPSFEPPSLTVDVARDVELHRYTGTVLQAGRFSLTTQDQHFGLSLQCIGKDEEPAGAIPNTSTASFARPAEIISPDPLIPFAVTLDDGSTSWEAHCESIDLNWIWDRKLREPERRTTPTGVYGGGIIQATGKIGTLYGTDSDFLLDAIRSRAPVSLTVLMTGEPMGGSAQEQLYFEFPVCQANGDPPTLRTSGFGNIDFSVDLGAFYSSADAFGPFRITLTNAITSYP